RGGPAGQELDRPPGNVLDNYGVMIEGYFYPNRTGAHVFALAADDGADLFLSTDADPAKAVQIATEPQWNPVRAFGTSGDGRRPTVDANTADERKSNLSKPINLTSGRPYYIRARMKEAGGGDNLAVAVGDSYASITDESLPIGGNQLSSIDRTDITLPYFGGLSGQANGFDFGVNDGQGKTVASATAKLNGASVPVTLTTRGGSRFITYRIANVAQYLPSGSTHRVEAELTDSAGGKQTRTANFTVGAYAALNPGHKVTSATQRGINHRVYQAEGGRPGGMPAGPRMTPSTASRSIRSRASPSPTWRTPPAPGSPTPSTGNRTAATTAARTSTPTARPVIPAPTRRSRASAARAPTTSRPKSGASSSSRPA
ncbi:MAG: PA14 domain-containing protein, partial [Verrucomicrobiota bacterium]